MQDQFFQITDENGKEYICDILMTFEENGNSYMIYTDNELDADGNLEVLATKFNIIGKKYNLFPIETDEEWDLVDRKWSEHHG